MVLVESLLISFVCMGQVEVPVVGEPLEEAPAVAALVREPMQATSPDGDLQVVLVGAVANAPDARTTRALIARRGELVRWTTLPLEELPAALVVPDADTIHCLSQDDELLTLDATGVELARQPLAPLLPPLAVRDADTAVTFAYDAAGVCLAVPLECGRLALVQFHDDAALPYQVCSFIRPTRLACGAEAWLDQARALAREGDDDAALYAYEAAIESSPEDPRGYRELASFHDRRGDEEARLTSLRMAMDRLFLEASGPVTEEWRVGTPEARIALEYVEARRDHGGLGGAHMALDEALSLYPCMAQAVLMRAEMLLEEDDLDGAIDAFEVALSRLGPEHLAAAHHDVGRFLQRHGCRKEALRYLEDAFALGDRSEFLLRGLADACEETGDHDRAAQWLGALRKRWQEIDNGESEPRRRARWTRRLAELDEEIERVTALALEGAPADH